MSALHRIIAAHPLADQSPYGEIKFSRVNGQKIPLYTVGNDTKDLGAAAAMRSALEQYGANCFYCGKDMPPQKMSHACTRDHLRPKKEGGSDYLHNLVFACGDCNREKGSTALARFRLEAGERYLGALDEHLSRCLKKLGS
jgi:5-methylcytosine-specific restriction endonuclease McrA